MSILVTPEELKEHALEFLKSQDLMVLGTSKNDRVWSATVYFAVTNDFEIIFYSRPDTRHAQNIGENPHVSGVITKTSSGKGKEKSIQLSGIARAAHGVEWNTYYPVFEKKVKVAGEHPDNIVYVIKPEEVWMIYEELGHRNRVKVF